VTGSGESEAEGDGGFLCYFLRSGDWFWRKEADGCADLLCWLRDSGEGKAYDDAGLLCWFPGSEESEADGDGGFLCYFLRSGKRKSRWWLNSSVGVAFFFYGHSAPLLVSPSLCFLSYPAQSLCLSLLYTLFSLFFFMSRCLILLLLFSFSLSVVLLFLLPFFQSSSSAFIGRDSLVLVTAGL